MFPISSRIPYSNHSYSRRVSSQGSQPLVANPPIELTGPNGFRHQTSVETTSLPAPTDLGWNNLSNIPSWYQATGTLYQNYIPNLEFPSLSEVGPSRSPTLQPTTRHHPYPRSRPERQEPHGKSSSALGHEIPSTILNYGLPTPDTPPQGSYLEECLRYPMGMTVSDNLHLPATTQEPSSLDSSARAYEGLMTWYHTSHTQPQHQQVQNVLHGPTVQLPTPLTGTNSSPEHSPRLPKGGEHKRLSRRADQKSRLGSPDPPITSGPRYATQQLVSHPYVRPANVRE